MKEDAERAAYVAGLCAAQLDFFRGAAESR